MQITIKKYGFQWCIYINNCRYKKLFQNEDEAYLSEDYKHFKELLDGRLQTEYQ